MTNKEWYSIGMYNGKSLLEWAKIWFKTDNDTFFKIYGFNFNPHKYPGLYEVARKEIDNEINLDEKLYFKDLG